MKTIKGPSLFHRAVCRCRSEPAFARGISRLCVRMPASPRSSFRFLPSHLRCRAGGAKPRPIATIHGPRVEVRRVASSELTSQRQGHLIAVQFHSCPDLSVAHLAPESVRHDPAAPTVIGRTAPSCAAWLRVGSGSPAMRHSAASLLWPTSIHTPEPCGSRRGSLPRACGALAAGAGRVRRRRHRSLLRTASDRGPLT